MKRCPSCAADIPDDPAQRRRRSPRGWVLAAMVLAAAAGVALAWRSPALVAQGAAKDACEPHGWVEWHLAMSRRCLSASYVCEHMTTPQLLEDPEVAAEYRGSLAAGVRPQLSGLVARMRRAYGCSPEPGADADDDGAPEGFEPAPTQEL